MNFISCKLLPRQVSTASYSFGVDGNNIPCTCTLAVITSFRKQLPKKITFLSNNLLAARRWQLKISAQSASFELLSTREASTFARVIFKTVELISTATVDLIKVLLRKLPLFLVSLLATQNECASFPASTLKH